MSKQNKLRSRKRMPLLFAFIFVMIAAVACVNDLTPEGGWSGPVAEGEDLYIGNRDGNLVKFDPASGNLDNNWRYPTGDGLGAMYSNAVVIGENIYSVGYTCRGDKCNGEIFGLTLANGTSIWGQGGLELETKLVGSIGVSGNTIFVGTTAIGTEEDGADGYFYAIDASPNAPSITRWRIPLDANAFSGVAIDGSTAYIATMAGTVYAIDISAVENVDSPSDRILWTYEAEGAVAGPILAESGSIYFGDFSNHAYRLNSQTRASGSQISELNSSNGEWKFDAGAWVWAEPVLEDGVVYISALDGSVFAVDSASGNEKWSTSIDGQIVSAPTLFDRDRGEFQQRVLAIPSGEKNVYAIDTFDGEPVGTFVVDERVKSSPLFHDGQLYIHALNGDMKWYSPNDLSQRGCIDLKGGGRCD